MITMILSPEKTKILQQVGFIPNYYISQVNPEDVYWYQEKSWIVGGCEYPPSKRSLLILPEIYTNGLRLITLNDLFNWLNFRVPYGDIQESIVSATHALKNYCCKNLSQVAFLALMRICPKVSLPYN